jgi:hypothetical protein
MMTRYVTLSRRIESEIAEIDQTQTVILKHWQRAQTAPVDQDAYVNSAALNLHSFYSGLERIFELIAVEMDGGVLGGDAWHSELLRQMTLDLPQDRPPVIQVDTASRLDEYRKFRHRIRNIYALNLDPHRMADLIADLPALWDQVRRQLTAFAGYLSGLSHADE